MATVIFSLDRTEVKLENWIQMASFVVNASCAFIAACFPAG